MKKSVVILWLLGSLFVQLSANEFVWFQAGRQLGVSLPHPMPAVVQTAYNMFVDDMQLVTGSRPVSVEAAKATVVVTQLNNPSVTGNMLSNLRRQGIPVKVLQSKKDAFFVAVIGRGKARKLHVVGSDARGTAYGILELSRLAGVSPWVWWADTHPDKKSTLSLPDKFSTLQSPSVEYRGIFLNDEDWTLQPWSWMHFEPSDIPGRIGPKTYKEIFKLLLRLRANTIWPGMHGMTTPFYVVPGAKEMADSCGIVIGTSHCEPMMRNNVGEWNETVRGSYNYITNQQSVTDYWTERLKEVKGYQCIFTIGMRGIHDGAMQGANTLSLQTSTLQRVINDQQELLKKYINPDVTKIPQQFAPYKEVLEIMDKGLSIPDHVTITWCDDNYGYISRLSDAEQQKRSGGSGIYYHLQYWGRPHDYMWLSSIQPGLIYNEMRKAYDHNARKIWIVNVHDMKTAAYNMELFLDLAWDINSVKPSTINDHKRKWLCREFGQEAGNMLLPAVLEYYRLAGIRKPEHMGWSQVELDRRRFPRGRSPVINTEFSLTEFGGELDRYMEDYQNASNIVLEAEKIIPPHRKDAFFSHVKYPILAATAMSVKMLEAQRARTIAIGNYNAARWTRETDLMKACAKSMNAYFEIRRLTDYWNNEMSAGKWKHSMCFNPRDLYVFFAPTLPIGLTEKEISHYAPLENKKSAPLAISAHEAVVRNAHDFTRASGNVYSTQALGHSMNALSLPKNASVTYEFECHWEGVALLRTAAIPVHPAEKNGDIRISVQLNNSEPQIISFKENPTTRTEAWKQNVLRGQALRTTNHTIQKGKQTLTITAIDDHVIIDQWMLDAKPERQFYVIPVRPTY